MELNTNNSTSTTGTNVEITSRTEEASLSDDQTRTAVTETSTESAEETNFGWLAWLKLMIPVPKWLKWVCLILMLLIGGTWIGIESYLARDQTDPTVEPTTETTAPSTLSPIWFETRVPSSKNKKPVVKDAVLMLNNNLRADKYKTVSVVIRLNGDSPSANWTSGYSPTLDQWYPPVHPRVSLFIIKSLN